MSRIRHQTLPLPPALERSMAEHPDDPTQWWPREWYVLSRQWLRHAATHGLNPETPQFGKHMAEGEILFQEFLAPRRVFAALALASPEHGIEPLSEFEIQFRLHWALSFGSGPVLTDAIRRLEASRRGLAKAHQNRHFLSDAEFKHAFYLACEGLDAAVDAVPRR